MAGLSLPGPVAGGFQPRLVQLCPNFSRWSSGGLCLLAAGASPALGACRFRRRPHFMSGHSLRRLSRLRVSPHCREPAPAVKVMVKPPVRSPWHHSIIHRYYENNTAADLAGIGGPGLDRRCGGSGPGRQSRPAAHPAGPAQSAPNCAGPAGSGDAPARFPQSHPARTHRAEPAKSAGTDCAGATGAFAAQPAAPVRQSASVAAAPAAAVCLASGHHSQPARTIVEPAHGPDESAAEIRPQPGRVRHRPLTDDPGKP